VIHTGAFSLVIPAKAGIQSGTRVKHTASILSASHGVFSLDPGLRRDDDEVLLTFP